MKNPEIDRNGSKFWCNESDQFHRIDGPAFEGSNGSKQWWVNGKLHRVDGPAVEYVDGHKEWYVNGKNLDKEEVLDWYTKQELDSNIPLDTDEQILFKLKFR